MKPLESNYNVERRVFVSILKQNEQCSFYDFTTTAFFHLITKLQMGQCMQSTVTSSRLHPLLGYLNELTEGKQSYYQLSFPVTSEEEYISWSKNIHKLRHSLEVRQYLYLPQREKFSQADGLCQGCSRVEAFFPPFSENLMQTLTKNINNRRHFHESYLWYLIYVLLKTIKYYRKRQKPIAHLNLENILVFSDSSLRIIPEDIIPNQDLGTTLYAQLQTEETTPELHRKKEPESLSDVYIAGAICLCMADLIHPAIFFNRNTNRWSSIGAITRKEALKNCEKRYSPLLVETLSDLTNKTKEQQGKLDALCKRLETFENEILAKKELGLGINLGYSSVDSIKTSYCVDNKTALSNNNSNLLRLSAVENESTSPSNRSVLLKEADEVLQDDDYLNIL